MGNPYRGPIVLPSQLQCLLEYHLRGYQDDIGHTELLHHSNLHFSNYEFSFINMVKPGEQLNIVIEPAMAPADTRRGLAYKMAISTPDGLAVMAYAQQTPRPQFDEPLNLTELGKLSAGVDRVFVGNGDYFLKRKFLSTGNAKTFISGSLGDQDYFIDESEGRVRFPEMFPAALITSAMEEQAWADNIDLAAHPMLWLKLQISVDSRVARSLASNDTVHYLVKGPEQLSGDDNSANAGMSSGQMYRCIAVLGDDEILFRSRILMVPMTR